jgi:hypothetical protein
MSVLSEIVAAASPPIADHAVPDPPPGRFHQLVEDPERLFVVEAVYEGFLLHYGSPRAFAGMDDDLRLLAGDALYALGLSRLAEAGDLKAVAELADLISLTAQAQAEGLTELADGLWLESARALSPAGGPGVRSFARDRLPRAP